MKSLATKLTIIALALLAPLLHAQRFAPLVAVKVGVVRNLQDRLYRDLPRISYAPELQIENELVALHSDSIVFSSALYGSYWDDGVRQTSSACVDCITRSFQSRTVGVRLGLLMTKFPVAPLGVFGGYARHFIFAEYVGGSQINGESGVDFKFKLHTLEAGAFVRPRRFRRWYLLGEVQRMFSFHTYQTSVTPAGRWAFKLGLAFRLIK